MNELHSLLKRQLRRFIGETESLLQEQADFLQAINDAYSQFDADRRMLEHSLELTSQELLEANAELSSRNTNLEMRVETRTAELRSSEARFRELFEHAPVSIWEEDFSAVRQYLDDLRRAGVVDFSAYFDAHPEEVAESAARVKIVDVNRATLETYQAESKEQLLADLSKVLGPESLIPFKKELLTLARGETSFGNETINYTLRGERRVVFVRLTVAPGSEQTWAKVFVSISDITERRQAEAALSAERDLLQALMDNIPDTIYFKDADSRFMRINRAQVNVLGIAAPEDAIGKTDFDFFQNAALVQSFHDEEQRIIETGEPLINRIEFNPTPDGKPRWFSATKVPIKDPIGHVIGIVGISRDITERNQVEETLRQSEERFRLMSWATKDAVWDWDLQTGRIWWGAGLQKIFRYPSETVETDSEWWLDRIHAEDRAKVNRVISQAVEGGMEFWSKEYRFQRLDGTYADIMDRAYIIRDTAGKAYRMVGAMMDVTDRKQAEQALLASETRYRQIVETAGDIIYRINLDGNLTYVNPTALRIMGYKSEEEVLDRHYLEFVHPAWRERVKHTYNRQFAEKTLNTYFEFLALTRERREIWLGQTVQIVMEDDRVIGFQAVARDITTQKEAEAALQEAHGKMGQVLTELQQRNRESALLNEMSHLLQACQTAEEAFGSIADLANQLFPHTAGALYLLNATHTQVSTIATWGEFPSTRQMFAPDDCRALRRSPTRQLNEDQRGSCCLHSAQPPAITYCLPIHVQGETLGIFHLQSTSEENLTENKRQLAYTVIEQSELALSNLKLREALREQSIRDPLTELYNRRYMEEALNQQLSRVTRQLHPLGLIMIDIDHFKNFNDTHGHAAGDALLRELGKLLQSHIRGGDVACRYGGEEFLLIMPDASLQAAHQRAILLQKEAKKLSVQDAGQSLDGITLSLGVAIYPEHGRSIDSVLRAADAALYRAKQEGRDRVVVAERAY
jgi:diguanylate cyclase (GGDEF)-like protein/PAS domain S-box-containing protein